VGDLLRIVGLSKAFGGVKACDGVDLTVPQGELLGLIGPNGAGKTTLTNLITGKLKPDLGAIYLDDEEVTTIPAWRRGLMGIARSHQITSIFPRFTALGNVALAVQAQEGHSFRFLKRANRDPALRAPALELLERVGLRDKADAVAAEMGHGELRQLEIAMALAMRPKLLLLDEPTAGMGAEETAKMVELIASLKGSLTIILIEHDMDAVFSLSDRIAVLVYGKVLACATPKEVRLNPEVRTAYLGEEEDTAQC
jgi:branched-chain amino acid transport system ATP-binding protein